VIPVDCMPKDGERVMEILTGPNREGKLTFFIYWIGTGHFTGPRGQIFLADPDQHPVDRIVDRRNRG
jgi:hypothetical protein